VLADPRSIERSSVSLRLLNGSASVNALVIASTLALSLVVANNGDIIGSRRVFAFCGLIHLVTAIGVFLLDGGSELSTLGIFSIAHGIFVGAAPSLATVLVGFKVDRTAWTCMASLHVGFTGIVLFCAGSKPVQRAYALPNRFTFKKGTWLVVGLAGIFLRGPVPELGNLLVQCALICWWVVALNGRVRRKLDLPGVLWVAAPFIGYVLFIFEKGGRLVIAGLAMSAFASFSTGRVMRRKKLLCVLLIPGFLWWAGMNRYSQDRLAAASNPDQVLDGLTSAYIPFYDFARIVRAEDSGSAIVFPRQYGQTYVETLVAPFPRSIWEAKPRGFGARLTDVFAPSLTRVGHSMAALHAGEAFVNFGWIGVAAIYFLLALTISKLGALRERINTDETGLPTFGWIFAVSGLFDFVWGGTFSTYVRYGFPFLAFFAVFSVERLLINHRGASE
jgi:hypothetical protein